jgi:hypothetical protein
MTMIFGFAGTDCPNADETKALAKSGKGRRNFLKIRSPFEEKPDRVGAVTATVLEDADIAARVGAAPWVDIAEWCLIIC